MPAAPSRSSRVIFITRFSWPDELATAQLLTDLAELLAERGDDVTVIASHNGPADLSRVQLHRGVTILRVSRTPGREAGAAGKALAFAAFSVGALWKLLFTLHRGDKVVVLTDPPLLGIGVWLVCRLCGARIFHWVQDIYPEIALALTGHRWLRLTRPLRNLAWRRSDGCITLGTDMAETLANAGIPAGKITISPNWSPAGLGPPLPGAGIGLRQRWQLEGKFIVAYSGNLGRVHDLDPVLLVAKKLHAESGIAFVFIGAGAQRAQLEARVTQLGLSNVHFHPAQPRRDLGATLAVADIHLVTLLPGCERLVFPSKLYGITAVGRPVIFIGPQGCELARLVVRDGFGLAFTQDEIVSIADALRQLSTDSARREKLAAAAEEFGRAHLGATHAAAVWQRLFSPVAGRAS